MVKNPPANAGDMSSIPGSQISPGEGHATHSRILAWEILRTEAHGLANESDMTQQLNNKQQN